MNDTAALITVRGLVQGVGFRPTMWRLAQRHGLRGWVANDGEGVRIHVCGPSASVDEFMMELPSQAPPLARIDQIEREPAARLPADAGFHIAASSHGPMRTGVPADAACCAACVAEIFDPFQRRFRYPFTNCTHCGPRLSIIDHMPYDRAHTQMSGFTLCAACSAEYADPANRRFHAEPIACHACGPRLHLVRSDGLAMTLEPLSALDAADAACTLLQRGNILAIQGLGGYQLACDATQSVAVTRLRELKHRDRKPFALMVRDLAVVRRHAVVSEAEAALLTASTAPIVVLDRTATVPPEPVADSVAPGLTTLGFMLPNTPLHHLMLKRMHRPIVMTSGNLSDEPQAIEAADARRRLGSIAEYFLEHDRPIARRVDDSVARVVAGRTRLLRRARGYAPASLPLPAGFEQSPSVLAFGGELKNTFCMLHGGRAILSTHLGDLRDAMTRTDYQRALADLQRFFEFEPDVLACDLHPDYATSHLAQAALAGAEPDAHLTLDTSQHHHAHIAACLADNGIPRLSGPVLGVALDGIGFGDDGSLWGGEFLFADYIGYRRLGTFKPVALLGGDAATREPWRNTYAHIMAQMGWPAFAMNYAELDLHAFLAARPRALLDAMLTRHVNSPMASSCGRLFDAAAAAMGIARENASYEGQGGVEMEAAVDLACLRDEDDRLSYPFAIPRMAGLPYIEPLGFWSALFGDLILKTPVGVMAARFHRGLSNGIVRMVEQLSLHITDAGGPRPRVVLTGGVFQNRILFERVLNALQCKGFDVLTHGEVPCNDGGLSFGQAVVAAARRLSEPRHCMGTPPPVATAMFPPSS